MLGAMLEWAAHPDLRLIPVNSAKGVKLLKSGKRERFLSEAELARLADALAAMEAEHRLSSTATAAIRMLLLSGCRKSEILSLRWVWVDVERGALRLPDSKTVAKSVVAHDDHSPGIESLRSYRNAIMAIVPDPAGLEKSIQRMQRWIAAEQIEAETSTTEAGKLAREQLKKQRPELIKALKLEAARAFTQLMLADAAALTIDERFVAPPDASPLKLPAG